MIECVSQSFFYKLLFYYFRKIRVQTLILLFYASRAIRFNLDLFLKILFWLWKHVWYCFRMLILILENFCFWFEVIWVTNAKVIKEIRKTENRKEEIAEHKKINKKAKGKRLGPVIGISPRPTCSFPNRYSQPSPLADMWDPPIRTIFLLPVIFSPSPWKRKTSPELLRAFTSRVKCHQDLSYKSPALLSLPSLFLLLQSPQTDAIARRRPQVTTERLTDSGVVEPSLAPSSTSLSFPSLLRMYWHHGLAKNRSRTSPPLTPEAAVVSGRCSTSHLEENDASVHVFETTIVFRTSSSPPPSPGASTSPPMAVYSAPSPEKARRNPSPRWASPLILF
jgi:hypothetical protein